MGEGSVPEGPHRVLLGYTVTEEKKELSAALST